MKLLHNNIYFRLPDEDVLVFDIAVKDTYHKEIRLCDNEQKIICSIGNVNFDEYMLEGGGWTPAPKTVGEQLAEAQALIAELQATAEETDELIADILEGM